MLPFETLIIIDKTLELPAYQQVANRIVKLIRNGTIAPGTLLPGTRDLAQMVKLHRKTIIAAYVEISIQGWVTVIAKKGHRVIENLPDVSAKKWDQLNESYTFNSKMQGSFATISYPINFELEKNRLSPDIIIDDGHPDSRLSPLRLLNREYQSQLRQQQFKKRPSYALASGSLKLRETLVTYIAETRGIQADISNILTTHGAQMSIFIAASLLLKRDSYVLVGEPGYYLANQVFEYLGAKIIRIPVDENGMTVDGIKQACENHPVALLYLIPHHHYPTTVTLSQELQF